jgi:DNA repair exonuclease SbcCD ATPase subunit
MIRLAEKREITHIRCPKCGREVPATMYCIYCGTKLPPKPAPPAVPSPPPSAPPKPAVAPPPPLAGPEDIKDLMTKISLQYVRKIVLLGLLQSKEVSEKVFLKLYDEYTGKLTNFLGVRARIMERLRSELEDRRKRYEEVKASLEELEVRQKIGEIGLQEFTDKAGSLKIKAVDIEKSLSEIKGNVSRLENIFFGKTPREIFDLEKKARTCHEDLERLVNEGSLSKESLEKIKPDIENMLELLNSLIVDQKKRQKALQEELETLETRYRVGEVSLEQYEKRKRELTEELEKIWT